MPKPGAPPRPDRPDPPRAVLLPAHRLSRRQLLGTATCVAVTGCTRAARWDVHPVAAQDGAIVLDLADHPPLATAGGMTAIQPRGRKRPLLVMRLENDLFRVLSLRCPHLGCTVRWDNERQLLVCPCHASTFDDTGRVLEGPADESLERYPATMLGTNVRISLPEES